MRRIGALCFLLLLAGCGSARRGSPVQSPFEAANERVATGEVVFMRYCNGCHPGGEAGLGPAINNKPLPAFLIRFQVRRGLGAMPAFSEEVISSDDLRDLTRYLVARRTHD